MSFFFPPDKYNDIPTLEAAYLAHIDKIKKMIPSDRLLIFNVKQGWEPLCQFLEKPVPDTPFPHVNDRAVMSALMPTLWGIVYLWMILEAAVLVGVLYALLRVGRLVFLTIKGAVVQRNIKEE